MFYAGGLVGACSQESSQFSYFKNSYNHGEIVVSEWPEDWMAYGMNDMQLSAGLVSLFGSAKMVNCYNTGKVISQCELSKHCSSGILGMMTDISDYDSRIYNCYSAGELVAGLEEWIYGVGEIYLRNIDNVYSMDQYMRHIAFNGKVEEWKESCVLPKDAFTDGTVLAALQGYATSGTASYDELDTLCGWVQGKQGPVFDWE